MSDNPDAIEALRLIMADPHGCPFCDSGKLRNPAREHDAKCGFAQAEAVLAKLNRAA